MAKVRAVFQTLVALLTLVVMCAGCTRTSARSVSLLGSTSIQPFAEMLAERYSKDHPGEFVEVQGGGSTAGLQAAESGLANIGMCSRSLTAKESLVFTSILIASCPKTRSTKRNTNLDGWEECWRCCGAREKV
jgi:phosphate transport system substrate-binding protein